MNQKTDYLIVGAGLSGVYMAYQFEKMGKDYCLIEARDRIGGRILSLPILNSSKEASEMDKVDMGPSWYWPQMHPRITQLIEDLELPVFSQYSQGATLFENQKNSQPTRYDSGLEQSPVSMRISGGMQSLVDALLASLPSKKVLLNNTVTRVERVHAHASSVVLEYENKQQTIDAKHVVFAMPLRLLADRIVFTPSLPSATKEHFKNTTTWMAAQAKFFAIYDTPFWRKEGLSGSVSSRVGPLVEIHDASTFDGIGALFGFIGIDAAAREIAGESVIKQAAMEQLTRIFGEQASKPIDIKLLDWSREVFTATQDDQQSPASHPRYGLLQSAKSLNKLHWYFAGTEAAEENGGYLEGALEAADAVIAKLDMG